MRKAEIGVRLSLKTFKYISCFSVLCGDFMFVIVFGQLALVLFFEKGNTYGSVSSFFISLLLRLLCGDPKMQLDRVISFGTIVTSSGEGDVPFRTIVCIIGIVTNLLVSLLTHHLFTEEKLDLSKDFFGCYKRGAHGEVIMTTLLRHCLLLLMTYLLM